MAKTDNRLGKGLGALIPDANTYTNKAKTVEEAIKTGAIAELDINSIETNPFQPRAIFDEESLEELANSIRELGIIQPITVRILSKNKYQIISGERRLRASKIAGLKKIPAFVRDANDQEMLEFALVENIQRENLNPIEIAITYQRLLEECELTHDQLSERTGKGRSSITNYLRLLNLPPEIQAGLRVNKISMGHAKVIGSLPDRHNQLKVFYKVLSGGLSVKKTEELVKSINEPKIVRGKTQIPENYRKLVNNIAQKLKTKVDVKLSKKGNSGKLIINFENEKLLEQILNSIEDND